jgi:hypothetical protein
MLIFALITQFSLNQSQRSIFRLRECAQSIPRIKLPLESLFHAKNLNFSILASINKPFFPESGKNFQASEMRAIDLQHKTTPRRIIFRIFEKKFRIENMKKSPKFQFFRYTMYIKGSATFIAYSRKIENNFSDFLLKTDFLG